MKISFGNMTLDLNIFNLKSHLNESCDQTLEVNAIHENSENESIDLNDERVAEYKFFFQDAPNKVEHTLLFESLSVESKSQPSSLIKKPPKLDLIPLPDHLKYVYLGDNETCPVIISSNLTLDQEISLLSTLSENKDAIG